MGRAAHIHGRDDARQQLVHVLDPAVGQSDQQLLQQHQDARPRLQRLLPQLLLGGLQDARGVRQQQVDHARRSIPPSPHCCLQAANIAATSDTDIPICQ